MMTGLGPSEKYVDLEWRYEDTEFITEYCIAEQIN
jgi:hypothetical protein